MPEHSEDRSQWRYEDGGPALEAAVAFVAWLQGLPDDADDGERLTTRVSWPLWKEAIPGGGLQQLGGQLISWPGSMRVRYPADGMAYVFYQEPDPDGTVDLVLGMRGRELRSVYIVTLLQEAGAWRVHGLDTTLHPPAEVGKVAYSW